MSSTLSGAEHLAIVEVGRPEAPAIVLAHGAGSSARFVEEACAGPLLEAGFRLVAYDLRGHGGSEPAPRIEEHHLDVHARDLAAVVASIPGEVLGVGGISLGGHAAVRAVGRGLVRTGPPAGGVAAVLAVLPAWTGSAKAGVGLHAAVAARVAAVGPQGMVEAFRSDPALPDWLRDTLIRDHLRHDPDSLVAALTALDGGEAPTREELAALPVPLGVVTWPADPAHPEEVALEWASSAQRAALRSLRLTDLDIRIDRLGDEIRALLDDLAVAAG